MTHPFKKRDHLSKPVETPKPAIRRVDQPDGTVLLISEMELEKVPHRITSSLIHWASVRPNQTFIAKRNANGNWESLNYKLAFEKVQHLASALLELNLSIEKPLVILSENSIEHALLALAAMHVGIPYTPVAPAYSLRSKDYLKLKQVIGLMKPGAIFVQDLNQYEKALQEIKDASIIITASGSSTQLESTSFQQLLEQPVTKKVNQAYQSIEPGSVAKVLFTSGSTGVPKGVINTFENLSSNLQQINQTFPFLKDEGSEFLDWLPWNHTFGGNHNFGLTLVNGGALYIDEGNPTPSGVSATIRNLKERNPTVYFNVPKGFEELLPYFKNDHELAERFFSRLKMLFYAGAGMPQHIWNAWEDLSLQYTGQKILIATGLGCTESSPSALFASQPGGFAGLLGVPVPGLELKLVPVDRKWEARYRGRNIFPGYWKQPGLNEKIFDEEGFYCTGDLLEFVDPSDANKGMIFGGRIAENFKLTTGTWVQASLIRVNLIKKGGGLIQDVVITGHDRDFIGAIVFPALDYCRKLTGLDIRSSTTDILTHSNVRNKLREVLSSLASESTGSASLVCRALMADLPLSIDRGEITDKGSLNQRMIIENFPDIVEKLYKENPGEEVVQLTNRIMD